MTVVSFGVAAMAMKPGVVFADRRGGAQDR